MPCLSLSQLAVPVAHILLPLISDASRTVTRSCFAREHVIVVFFLNCMLACSGDVLNSYGSARDISIDIQERSRSRCTLPRSSPTGNSHCERCILITCFYLTCLFLPLQIHLLSAKLHTAVRACLVERCSMLMSFRTAVYRVSWL